MITWKTIRYKHLDEFKQLGVKISEKKLTDRDATLYILSFVKEWDFADADTGAGLDPATPETLDLLSIAQYQELCKEFNEQMGSEVVEVKKTKQSSSSSGSTRSKRAKQTSTYQTRPNGLG